jgi:hypothetical protein
MFFQKFDDDWKVRFVRHFYEKDKLIPVDPRRVPSLDDDALEAFPEGYRYLAYCQETCMPGCKVKKDMPGHRGPEHDKLLVQCKEWLQGDDVEI